MQCLQQPAAPGICCAEVLEGKQRTVSTHTSSPQFCFPSVTNGRSRTVCPQPVARKKNDETGRAKGPQEIRKKRTFRWNVRCTPKSFTERNPGVEGRLKQKCVRVCAAAHRSR